MRGFNKVIIAGNLTRDPETRTTSSGASVCGFSIAVNRRYKTNNGEWRDEVSYFDCSAWGKQGETLQQYVHKGSPLLISGRLRQNSWEDKATQQKRSKVEIIVEDFNFIGNGSDTQGNGGSATTDVDASSADEQLPQEDDMDNPISLDEVPF